MRPWEKKKKQEVPPAYTGRAVLQPKPPSWSLIAFNSLVLRPLIWAYGLLQRPLDYQRAIIMESRVRRCEMDILFLNQTLQNEIERNRELQQKLGVPFQRYRISQANYEKEQQNAMLTAQLQGATGLPIPGELLMKILDGKDITAKDYMAFLPVILPLLKAQQGQVAQGPLMGGGGPVVSPFSPPTSPTPTQGQPEGKDEGEDNEPKEESA